MRADAPFVCAVLAIGAFALPSKTQETTQTIHAPIRMAAASDAYEDGLLFSNDGPMVFLRDHKPRSAASARLKFETDACGFLVSVRNRHAMLQQASFADDRGDFDEDDPAIQGQALVSRWLSTHPEIALISDGIDKWCDDLTFVGEEVLPEFRADMRLRNLPPVDRPRLSRKAQARNLIT